jgi:hypothetical protein
MRLPMTTTTPLHRSTLGYHGKAHSSAAAHGHCPSLHYLHYLKRGTCSLFCPHLNTSKFSSFSTSPIPHAVNWARPKTNDKLGSSTLALSLCSTPRSAPAAVPVRRSAPSPPHPTPPLAFPLDRSSYRPLPHGLHRPLARGPDRCPQGLDRWAARASSNVIRDLPLRRAGLPTRTSAMMPKAGDLVEDE